MFKIFGKITRLSILCEYFSICEYPASYSFVIYSPTHILSLADLYTNYENHKMCSSRTKTEVEKGAFTSYKYSYYTCICMNVYICLYISKDFFFHSRSWEFMITIGMIKAYFNALKCQMSNFILFYF